MILNHTKLNWKYWAAFRSSIFLYIHLASNVCSRTASYDIPKSQCCLTSHIRYSFIQKMIRKNNKNPQIVEVVNFVQVSVSFLKLKQYVLVLKHFEVLFRDYIVYTHTNIYIYIYKNSINIISIQS